VWNFEMSLADAEDNWADQKVYGLWDKKPLTVNLTARSK